MSITICQTTGITTTIDDDITHSFILDHPLSNYNVVKSTISELYHSTKQNKQDAQDKVLLAGSILSILTHHDLILIHNKTEAKIAHDAIVAQCTSSHQLYMLATKLIRCESELNSIKRGIRQPDGSLQRKQFSIECASAMGTEMRGEESRFFICLAYWLGKLLPLSSIEIEHAAQTAVLNKPLFDLDMELIETSNGTIVNKDKLLTAVKNKIEDNITRTNNRLGRKKATRIIKDKIKLATDCGIFTIVQKKKLYAMVNADMYSNKQVAQAIELVETAAYKEKKYKQQLKLFKIAGWLRVAVASKEERIAKAAKEVAKNIDLLGDVVHDIIKDQQLDTSNMTVRERMAALRSK